MGTLGLILLIISIIGFTKGFIIFTFPTWVLKINKKFLRDAKNAKRLGFWITITSIILFIISINI